jgi:hypothetical protein
LNVDHAQLREIINTGTKTRQNIVESGIKHHNPPPNPTLHVKVRRVAALTQKINCLHIISALKNIITDMGRIPLFQYN